MIVISGPPGVGKTTFTLNIAAHHAADGVPTLVYCVEMSVTELVAKVVAAHYQITLDEITPAVIARARQDLADWPLYLGSDPRVTKAQEVVDLLAQARRRYGLGLVAFDNVHSLCRNIQFQTQEEGVVSKSFKAYAMTEDIPVIVIAQPRKLDEPDRIMTGSDLKGNNALHMDADQIILLHRKRLAARDASSAVADAGEHEKLFSPIAVVRVEKVRLKREGSLLLYFDGDRQRFREVTPEDLETTTAPRHRGYRDE
jgi:replicative DNA helicase